MSSPEAAGIESALTALLTEVRRISERLGPQREERPPMKMPQRTNAVLWHRSIPGFLEQFDRIVPGDFWSQDQDEGSVVAIISCPCGARTPTCREGATAGCACDRVYLFTGSEVRVASSPLAA